MLEIPSLVPLWIGGEEVSTKSFFSTTDPYNNELIARVSIANEDHVKEAVEHAHKAQLKWAKRSAKERANILRKVATLLRQKNEEFAEIETKDTGRPLRETLVADALSGAECLEYMAALCEVHSTRHIPLEDNNFAYTVTAPLGICAGIGAWNYPVQIACWKSAAALATGNAFIFKPSELTPLSAFFLAQLYQEAGLPAGLFQVLQGDASVGGMLVNHPRISKVSLTGSVATGKQIAKNAAENLKKLSLELGGKGPIIIFEDADIEGAVQGVMLGNFYSQGEICSNGTRVYIHANIKEKFVEKLLEETKKIVVGDPCLEETHLGPLISPEHKRKVEDAFECAKDQGARTLCGGPGKGNFFLPTILDNCQDDMSCVQEEIFGPIVSLLSFKDEEEVIERANATQYGLAGAVFTMDVARAHRVAHALEVGVAWINAYNLTPVQMPFGGVKQSGVGKENGQEVFKEYTQTKTIYVNGSGSWDSFF